MAKEREGEEKEVKEEMRGAKEEKREEATNKKFDLAKRIKSEKGSDEGYMKEATCKICGKKHKTSEHHKHKK